jgi:DNA-binding XRE family transcriptional regulator
MLVLLRFILLTYNSLMSKHSLAIAGIHPEALESLVYLGRRIRAQRIACGWTIKQMAERLYCSQNTYRSIEMGKPTASLGVMASALWLFGQVDTLNLVAPIPIEAVTVQRVRARKNMGLGRLISEAERDF